VGTRFGIRCFCALVLLGLGGSGGAFAQQSGSDVCGALLEDAYEKLRKAGLPPPNQLCGSDNCHGVSEIVESSKAIKERADAITPADDAERAQKKAITDALAAIDLQIRPSGITWPSSGRVTRPRR
jgi:hypothetical protein